MPKFYVTYDIVTPESAQHGDAEERGFVLAGGEHVELKADVFGPEAGAVKDECALTLREAIDLIGCVQDGGSAFYETDERQDYRTGHSETRALHPPVNITAASYGRLIRLLRSQRLL